MAKSTEPKRLALAAKNMPPLYHSLPGREFDIHKSEVIKWLISQQSILQYIFDKAKDGGFIIYNPETKKWQGKNYGN